jgi:hypothetical protein
LGDDFSRGSLKKEESLEARSLLAGAGISG